MSAAALEAFFRTAARPAAAAASPAGGPEAAAGGGVVAEDERGRLYVAGADGLLRCADARAVALVVSPGGQHAALAGAPHT